MRTGVRLALDWGKARIGVAACDAAGVLAYPVGTVTAGDREVADVLALVAEYEPIELVVGLPLRLAGDEGPAAAYVRERATALAAATPVPVRLVDERLSTVTASKRLRAGGRDARAQRAVIDAAAAVAILEAALAAEAARGVPPGDVSSAGPPLPPSSELPEAPPADQEEAPS